MGFTRDTATLITGQYFKRRRELVEIFLVSSTGLAMTLFSPLIVQLTTNLGWRLSLQIVSVILASNFFLGTFYRSASLYHPQRRAIIHLKTQRRKIKSKQGNKEKVPQFPPELDSPPMFEFSTLRSRTIQILLFSTALASLGINAPLFLLVSLY